MIGVLPSGQDYVFNLSSFINKTKPGLITQSTMSQLLTWSEVDSNIQSGMGNRCPSEYVRLEAINNEVRNINTVYDIETTIRLVDIYIIPDGTKYNIDEIEDDDENLVITDDDFKKVADIYINDDNAGNEYIWQEPEEFFRRIRMGYKENTYTSGWENGQMYLAVNSEGAEAVATNYKLRYYSTFLGIDSSGDFKKEVIADIAYKILLPERFKDLVVAGSKMRLFWPSIGEDGNNQYAIESNKYKSELNKLGLDNTAKPIKRPIRKVKLRVR